MKLSPTRVLPSSLLFVSHIAQVCAHPSPRNYTKRFESAEHKSIGDSVQLSYPSYTLPGNLFAYAVGKNILSFGDIVALAGDFYANWSAFKPGCQEQISDNYDTNPSASIKIFNEVSNWLQTDNGGYMSCVLGVMKDQQAAVENGMEGGEDPAQIYAAIASDYDERYFKCSSGYAWIALCNFDHFGEDAIRAYKAGHTSALNQAVTAYQTKNEKLLTQAYFLEAFAQHFLTDIFAAGHSREPRRQLHWTVFDKDPDAPEFPQPYPADRCAQAQHDEENANGLWMQNAAGDSWPSYGDKELFSGKSAVNKQQAIKACQAGLAEIYSTFQTGNAPAPASFAALSLTPILSQLSGDNNFVPMFTYSAQDPDHLYLRTNLDQRYNKAYTQYANPPSLVSWESILSLVQGSGSAKGLHPYTEAMTSPNQIFHVREAPNSNLVVNVYGGSPAGSQPWNMLAQTEFGIQKVPSPTKWVSVNYPYSNIGIFVLVGRTPQADGSVRARHIGIFKDPQLLAGPAKLVWEDIQEDGNDKWTEGGTALGVWSEGGQDYGIMKYFTNGGDSKLELWTMPSKMEKPPANRKWSMPTGKINFLFSIPLNFWRASETFIATGFDLATKVNTWYFVHWSNNYDTATPIKVVDKSVTYPSQVMLPWVAKNVATFVRLSYGPSFPTANTIQVDYLTMGGSGNSPSIQLTNRQTFPITWPTLTTQQYLSWNLTDVNGDGIPDIIAYTQDASNTKFQSIVMIANKDRISFGSPTVTPLTVPATDTSFFAGEFMNPMITRGVDYMDPNQITNVNQGGFMSFFDNYGILGARTAAPVVLKGDSKYEIKGQTPGIAGQSSAGLGVSPVDVMGTGAPAEQLGFVVIRNEDW